MNELLLFLTALVSAALVWGAWRLGKERLYSLIIVFLILIAATGGKVVLFFGHETNTGNIFYASVYLATYFLIERYGRKEGIYSIWVGVAGVVSFTILADIAVALTSSGETAPFNAALAVVFGPVSRVAFASILAYVCSQNFNVYFYLRLKKRMEGSHLWLRANISNACSQVLDSVIFFTVAFWGVVAPSDILDILLTGLAIKIAYMMFASLLLYFNKIEEEDDGTTVVIRL